MKCVIPLRIIVTLFFLVGCVPVPPTPLPTPTVVAGNVLPIEKILRGENGSICGTVEAEYQIFFIPSAEVWQDLQLKLHSFASLGADGVLISEVIDQTNFQTHSLLWALRTCKSSGGYSIAIDRVVENSSDQLTVYIELRDPPPGSAQPAVVTGPHDIVRIPWPTENSDTPTLEFVDYRLWSDTERPTPLPAPTLISGNELPIEIVQQGAICENVEEEFQLFFVRNEAAWRDVWSGLQASQSLKADEDAIAKAVQETDFQTQALLLAFRTCHPYGGGYAISIAHAVEISDNHLTVYVELRDPAPGSNLPNAWFYQIARIPWAKDNADNPTVEAVDYLLWSEMP